MIEGELIVNPDIGFEREIASAVIKHLVESGKKELGQEAVIPRQILPATDLNQPREVWEKDLTGGTINDYNPFVSDYKLSDKRLIAFWGVMKQDKGDDIVTTIRFRSSTEKVIGYWEIEDLEPGDKAILTKPQDAPIYDPKDSVDIYFYIEAQGITRLKLLGAVVEMPEIIMGPKSW